MTEIRLNQLSLGYCTAVLNIRRSPREHPPQASGNPSRVARAGVFRNISHLPEVHENPEFAAKSTRDSSSSVWICTTLTGSTCKCGDDIIDGWEERKNETETEDGKKGAKPVCLVHFHRQQHVTAAEREWITERSRDLLERQERTVHPGSLRGEEGI